MEGGQMETVLVYLGPSLPLANAKAILPEAIYRPPARQADIVSDVTRFKPTHIILIDGCFRESLSPWHKELLYALQYPGIQAVYGAASMGALRAAELDYLGMIGLGKIYQWYRDGVTEDDAEVAVNYAEHKGLYHLNSVPLVDIRAGVESLGGEADWFLDAMREIPYEERTRNLCEKRWQEDTIEPGFPCIPQKQLDAELVLREFREHKPQPTKVPTPGDLTLTFEALYQRDRRIDINGVSIPQQHLDAYVLLHNPEWERICWDSANQELALILCNVCNVQVSLVDIERESGRFQQRAGIETIEDFNNFLECNGWNRPEFNQLMIRNARIRSLQHQLSVTKVLKRNTQAILDYLRTHQGFDYWALQAAQVEARLENDDSLLIDLEISPWSHLAEHMENEGLELKLTPEEYLLETGFSNLNELTVALQRTAAGKETDG
jgi:hypothetical protein